MDLFAVLSTATRCLPVLLVFALGCATARGIPAGETADPESPPQVRDLMWVWGNPSLARPGPHTVATYAQASPAERAELLDVPHVIMAGRGLPKNDADAEALMQGVKHMPRIIWEIEADPEEGGPPFVYTETIARVHRLAERYSGIEGVLLDDMSSLGLDKGFEPEHIRNIRALLGDRGGKLRTWGVLYTMNYDRENIDAYIHELDGISLWTWHAKDIPDMERNVAVCEERYPGKPILLGLYMYDYGDNRRMPLDLMEQQCETALKLAHEGRVEGIVFLSITDDGDAVGWTADWIRRVINQQVGSPPSE
jgi:hypothetical protein